MRTYPTMDGDHLKQMAMFNLEVSQETFLETMRSQARIICRVQGFVTTDDLREYADTMGLSPQHKNAWGRVLCEPDFKPVGYVKSRWRSNRARRICQWVMA